MDDPVQILDNETEIFPSKYVACNRRWLNYQIKIYLVRLDEYTIELKLMTFINGERRCIRIIPSSAKLVRLFNIINDMIPVIVNQNIENDLSFPNDCQSVHILVSQPVVKPADFAEKLNLSPEKTDISDGSFSIASRFPDHIPTYVLPGTLIRRIRKVISGRYMLILLIQRIEEMIESLPEDFSEIINSSPLMPMQIEAFKFFGFRCGYQLQDGSLGLSFVDRSNLIMLPNFSEMYYVDKWGKVRYFQNEQCSPSFLQYKLTLLTKLKEIAVKYDDNSSDGRQSYDIPYLIRWMRWKRSSVLFFNNGRLEIVYELGKKVIFSPFSKPVCVTAKKKLAQATKLDCKFAVEVCTILMQRYFRQPLSLVWYDSVMPSVSNYFLSNHSST